MSKKHEELNILYHFEGIIKLASETCCYGCQNIHYVETNDSASSFEQQISKYDLILPFKNRRNALTFNSHPYVQILTIENMKIFHPKHIQADYLLEILVAGTYETWPLFIIALVMAFSFGAIVWLLVRSSYLSSRGSFSIQMLCTQSPAPSEK